MSISRLGTCTLVALSLAGPVAAQSPESPSRAVDRDQLRHQIYVMEGALVRAVEFGAQSLNRVRSAMPDIFMLAGDAQARGVYLENYGIFFDVQVPILRQSMMWGLRMMLEKDEAGTKAALDSLRGLLQNTSLDARSRADAENAIRRLEIQLSPMQRMTPTTGVDPRTPVLGASLAATPSPSSVAATVDVPPGQAERRPQAQSVEALLAQDPNQAYTESVQSAVIDAMIDYSAPMRIGAEEWLTVAARDNERRDSLAPQDPTEEIVTLLYQIRGSDLAAYRAGTIDRDEVRRRVVVREF